MDTEPDSWHAMRHSEFADWAGLQLGDTRQVHARDSREPPDAPLVFMPDGEARQFRADAQAGHLVCPVPGCPYPKLTTRHADDRRDHFVHTHAPELEHPDFRAAVTQQMLHRWAVNLDPTFEALDGQTIAEVPISVLVRLPTGSRVALCYSAGVLGAEAWQEQHAALERAGVAGVWMFPPRHWYFARPKPDPAPPGDDNGGLIVDRRLFKVMRRNGSWPLIINIEREQVANLIVPGKAIAGRLHMPEPRLVEDVVHVVVSPLARCSLCPDGFVTLAVNENDLKKIREGYLNSRRHPRKAATQGYNKRRQGKPYSRPYRGHHMPDVPAVPHHPKPSFPSVQKSEYRPRRTGSDRIQRESRAEVVPIAVRPQPFRQLANAVARALRPGKYPPWAGGAGRKLPTRDEVATEPWQLLAELRRIGPTGGTSHAVADVLEYGGITRGVSGGEVFTEDNRTYLILYLPFCENQRMTSGRKTSNDSEIDWQDRWSDVERLRTVLQPFSMLTRFGFMLDGRLHFYQPIQYRQHYNDPPELISSLWVND